MDINRGKHCLIVSIERDDISVTPKGKTEIKEGDELVILVSRCKFSSNKERLEKIIN